MTSKLTTLALLAALASTARAGVTVSDAWVRGTVAQQTTTGLFFNITSAAAARLLAVRTPAARSVELHEMRMDGDMMTMRPVQSLELPAGRRVQLQPGGVHVMLVGLVHALSAGETVPVTLVVQGAGGKREEVQVMARVEALGAPHAMGAMSGALQ